MAARRRTRQTTDDFLNSVLDDEVRAAGAASQRGGNKKQMQKNGRQLSNLYGSNSSSTHVKRRASKMVMNASALADGLGGGDQSSAHARRHSRMPLEGMHGGTHAGGMGDSLDSFAEGKTYDGRLGHGHGNVMPGQMAPPPRRLSVVESARQWTEKRVNEQPGPEYGGGGGGTGRNGAPLHNSRSAGSVMIGGGSTMRTMRSSRGGGSTTRRAHGSMHSHADSPAW